MAQVNLTLTHEEVLQVLTGDREEAIRFLLERILNEIMKAESEEQLGAARHERTEERQDYRKGSAPAIVMPTKLELIRPLYVFGIGCHT